jgi:pilus assembly protein CpaB
MNSTFLRILATLMAVAATITAYLGYRITQEKPTAAVKVVAPTYSRVVAKTDIAAGHVLSLEDMGTEDVSQPDTLTFNSPEKLIGKIPIIPVSKGVAFNTSHFPSTNSLGQTLAPNERAVAIKVNEVVGAGGFIKPGDHVDVLLYLRTERETGDISSAQVVLSDVKVLAYGELIKETGFSEAHTKTENEPDKSASNKPDVNNGKNSRSALLVVPEKDVSKLMLADSTGTLRLALRNEYLPTAAANPASESQFIRLGELAHAPEAGKAAPLATRPSPDGTKKNSAASAVKRDRVILHRGEQTEVINVAR